MNEVSVDWSTASIDSIAGQLRLTVDLTDDPPDIFWKEAIQAVGKRFENEDGRGFASFSIRERTLTVLGVTRGEKQKAKASIDELVALAYTESEHDRGVAEAKRLTEQRAADELAAEVQEITDFLRSG